MKIRNITINSFGKLNNYSLELSGGVDVVYGPNEYGKTTIMEFIKIMFYSKNEKSATDKLVREKYKPWNGSAMSGSIEFEQGGQIYKIEKEISEKSPRSDKTVIRNMSVGDTVKLGKDEEAGEHFFGIDVKSFERSSYIKNLGSYDFESAKSSKNAKDTLADKMFSNLMEAGEEDVSQSAVISKIKEAMKELKTPTGRSGGIRKLENEISALKLKINDIDNFEKSQDGIKKELENLSALISEQKMLETKIKKFDEYKRMQEIKNILEMTNEKEKLRKKAAEFGLNLDFSQEILDELERYQKDLSEINLKIENIKNFSENRGKNSPKISEEEKNRFETMLGRFEHERERTETLKYITPDNLRGYESDNFELPENLKNIILKIKNSERLKAFKSAELEKTRPKSKRINRNLLVADVALLAFLIICIIFGLVGFFPFALGLFLCGAVAHLVCFCKAKKSLQVLENEISEKNAELDNLKQDFKIESERMRLEAENKLENTEKEIKNFLSEKKCSNRNEFYQNYAKSQEFEDFSAVLQVNESKRGEILEDLRDFISSKGMKISTDAFSQTLDFLKAMNSKYRNINNEIRYKAGAINLQKTDLQSLKSILEESSCAEVGFEFADIDSIRLRFAQLKKMDLHSAYIETQKKIVNTYEDPEILRASLEKSSLQKGKMEEYYECLKISLGALEEVSDELRKNFNPKLNNRASEIFKNLTGGKYKNLYIQKNYDFIVSGETIDRGSNYFSSGTIDQAYLAVRIAISELISSSKVPLIFDDTLMQYDDERLKNATEFLKSYAETNGVQAIIFTCHDYVNAILSDKFK